MRYEWDEAKRESNLRKHAIDFAKVERFDWSSAAIEPNDRMPGENRLQATGYLDAQVVVIVYVERGEATRIISMRRATPKEKRRFANG